MGLYTYAYYAARMKYAERRRDRLDQIGSDSLVVDQLIQIRAIMRSPAPINEHRLGKAIRRWLRTIPTEDNIQALQSMLKEWLPSPPISDGDDPINGITSLWGDLFLCIPPYQHMVWSKLINAANYPQCEALLYCTINNAVRGYNPRTTRKIEEIIHDDITDKITRVAELYHSEPAQLTHLLLLLYICAAYPILAYPDAYML